MNAIGAAGEKGIGILCVEGDAIEIFMSITEKF